MNITEAHKELFLLAAELFESDPTRLWICPTITWVSVEGQTSWELRAECRQIVHEVFNDSNREVIWSYHDDCNCDYEFARNCRIIALYSLIYADL